jgi:hypothetical protein
MSSSSVSGCRTTIEFSKKVSAAWVPAEVWITSPCWMRSFVAASAYAPPPCRTWTLPWKMVRLAFA